MALAKKFHMFAPSGKTVYAILSRDSDGKYLQVDGTFAVGVAYPAFAEDATAKGLYILTTSATAWSDGTYVVAVYQQTGGSPSPAADAPPIGGTSFTVLSDTIVTLDGSIAANTAAILSNATAIAANAAAIAAIPTNPLLTTDARLPNTVIAAKGDISSVPSPVVVPLITGAPSTVELTAQTRIALRRGDSYRLTFSLGRDCTGWTPYFGAKADPLQVKYDMPVREVVLTDVLGGAGYIDISTDDTAVSGTFFGELELRSGVERNTPMAYSFRIVDDVVR